MRTEKRKRWIGAAILAVVILSASLTVNAGQRPDKAVFTGKGELKMPKNYRQWVFVGAPLTPNDMNGGKAAFPEFHHVYIDPKAFSVYKKSGIFPDGTILVKELVSVAEKSASSGNGYFAGDFIGVAAAVKDSRRFAKEPGHWAYFSFMGGDGKALSVARAQATEACNACHANGAAADWVFTQYYPVLGGAKGGQ